MPQAPPRRDISESSDVGRLVRLHHRRRGWAWVATGSALGLAVYAGVDASLFEHLTGTAATVSVIAIFTLLALLLAGLVVVIVDTALIHRAGAAVQVSAKGRVSHYPLYAQAYRWPPRHPASWVAAIFMLVAMTSITAYILPAEVNAWADVVGAAHHDTFNPVSYRQACTLTSRRMHCTTVTEGYLSHSSAGVYWDGQAPLGQPVSVRDPFWAWGTGRSLISGDGTAIPTILAGLFFDGVALLLLYIIVVLVRETSPTQRHRTAVPAGADPGGVRRTHQPDRGHRGSGRRRHYARRGRARH
jgi:hypothetical protein